MVSVEQMLYNKEEERKQVLVQMEDMRNEYNILKDELHKKRSETKELKRQEAKGAFGIAFWAVLGAFCVFPKLQNAFFLSIFILYFGKTTPKRKKELQHEFHPFFVFWKGNPKRGKRRFSFSIEPFSILQQHQSSPFSIEPILLSSFTRQLLTASNGGGNFERRELTTWGVILEECPAGGVFSPAGSIRDGGIGVVLYSTGWDRVTGVACPKARWFAEGVELLLRGCCPRFTRSVWR
ncbi:hypothetical protein Droror1_Dr00016075 [Drosera rotundifolia]